VSVKQKVKEWLKIIQMIFFLLLVYETKFNK